MEHNGYQTTKGEPYVHRARAYHIYLENRKKYPLPYTAYEVHHIDFDKMNNKVSNLQILTPTEHDKVHKEYERKKKMKKRKKEEEEKSKSLKEIYDEKLLKYCERHQITIAQAMDEEYWQGKKK